LIEASLQPPFPSSPTPLSLSPITTTYPELDFLFPLAYQARHLDATINPVTSSSFQYATL
jgi:hypothetical protein